jgi:hypothetical protein
LLFNFFIWSVRSSKIIEPAFNTLWQDAYFANDSKLKISLILGELRMIGNILTPLRAKTYQETSKPYQSAKILGLAGENFNLRLLDTVVISSRMPNSIFADMANLTADLPLGMPAQGSTGMRCFIMTHQTIDVLRSRRIRYIAVQLPQKLPILLGVFCRWD